MRTSSPWPTISTWSISIVAPSSALSFSTRKTSPWAARYCLPPVENTAYMDILRKNLQVKSGNSTGKQRCSQTNAALAAARPAAVILHQGLPQKGHADKDKAGVNAVDEQSRAEMAVDPMAGQNGTHEHRHGQKLVAGHRFRPHPGYCVTYENQQSGRQKITL